LNPFEKIKKKNGTPRAAAVKKVNSIVRCIDNKNIKPIKPEKRKISLRLF